MLWLFQKLFDRLVTKLMLVASAKIESEIEMEAAYMRAEMVRIAEKLEGISKERNGSIAETLRRRADRLGLDGKGPACEVIELVEGLREENLQESVKEEDGRETARPALPSPAKKKRGRPRKNPEAGSSSEPVGN